MRSVGTYEAKTHLPRLLEEVARGETITITKHGVPVAQLVPPPTERQRDPADVIADIQRFRQDITLDGLSLRDLIEEGRR